MKTRTHVAAVAHVAAVVCERLEGRELLSAVPDGPLSVQLGQTQFYSTSDGGLWKSELDGSNAELIHHFQFQSHWLTAFHGSVYFAAYESIGSGEELWRTDGEAGSTRLVKDLYPYGANSRPHDFMIVNDRL